MPKRPRSRGLASVLLCLSFLLAAAIAPAQAKTPGRTLFANSFESRDFAGWYLQSLPGRARVVSGDAFDGRSDARFEVRVGDVEPDTGSNRSEVAAGTDFDAGDVIYVRDAIRVPAADSYSGPWQIINQLHETDWGGSPGIAVFLNSDRSLKFGAGDGSPTYWRGPRLGVDRWHNLLYRVKLSQDPRIGFVEVWFDGKKQRLTNGRFRAHGQTIQSEHTYLKIGIYRSSDSRGTSVVEHDGIVVSARGKSR